MNTQGYIKCPVHGDKLPQEDFYGMSIYFCEKCQKYYSKSQNLSKVGRATYNGHPVIFEQNLEVFGEPKVIKNPQPAPIPKPTVITDHFQSQFDKCPDSPAKLICPIHKNELPAKLAIHPIKARSYLVVAWCTTCDTLYTNDKLCIAQKHLTLFNKRLLWSPIEMVKKKPKKKNSKYQQVRQTVSLKSRPINIIPSKSQIPAHPNLLADCENMVRVSFVTTRVHGYFAADSSYFYCTPEQFYQRLLPEDIPNIKVTDPDHILEGYIQSNKNNIKSHLNATRKLRSKSVQEQIDGLVNGQLSTKSTSKQTHVLQADFSQDINTVENLTHATSSSQVLVFANTCHCSKCRTQYKQDTIRNRTAIVNTLRGDTAKITVQFCIGCGRYFMNITTFRECCKKYGGLLLECKMDAELASQNSSWINFAPDTILSRCGYSVKKGIPRIHRQMVLSYILDSGKATKYEVQEILSRFIRLRKHYQPDACARWQEDILFVNQYQIQKQEIVEGLTFKKSGNYKEKN